MSLRGRRAERELEHRVAKAIETNVELDRARQEALERAARMDDIRGGLLALHPPHPQARPDDGEPPLFCTECASPWPCRTIQFTYRFGEFARQQLEE